jgi:acyl-CoA synthetase (AMP-forming)/AMP-acid ligase II/acyl carrier protein
MSTDTIFSLIKSQAENKPDFPAILSLDREPLTYSGLFKQMLGTIQDLNESGVGRGDRVALALPNGPEMAIVFLAVAACASCAPLNPNYRNTEFDFYLTDLKARALIVMDGINSPALEVAVQRNIPVFRLIPEKSGSARSFKLAGDKQGVSRDSEAPGLADIALILHTSGTTSRPKMVPLSQRNLSISAQNIASALQLSTQDRCLNIMPLFHIHGLMAGLLASLKSGGSVACTPGFYAPHFFDWLEQFQPTWYTAVPTMHQTILERAAENQARVPHSRLRFLRSSSAPLAPQVMSSLERVFDAPFIEAYGMTEASHQIASNPLPPGIRKPGSVGLPAGPDIAIMSEEDNTLLARGQTGEIVIRGDNIMHGYDSTTDINDRAFSDGWFRTGDLGSFDEDGYLFINGRLKEIINRGGEKISPREIDEVLLEHPAVAQALSFAVNDPQLGEDIAAAVVLHDPAVTEKELRHYLGERLADHKVPRQIVILEDIPKGPTGKPQRIGLAKKLGLDDRVPPKQSLAEPFLSPVSETEMKLAGIWCEVLKLERVSINHRFIERGGDSMTAMQMINRVGEWIGATISIVDFFEAQTIQEQAKLIDRLYPQSNPPQTKNSRVQR